MYFNFLLRTYSSERHASGWTARKAALAGLVLAAGLGGTLPGVASGQSAQDSAAYVRAQQMAANGDAAGGRRLADSVAGAAQPGSAAFAEGLFWRATLATNARDSEHEYRQIIVDYPLSGRVPDALLRIGQLESSRGEKAAALQHFQRLVLEHPQSPLRADGSYWVAQMYFDANDPPHACSANADALSNVAASNIELKNRIDFQQQRCRGVALATSTAPAPVVVPVTSPVTSPAAAPVNRAPDTERAQPERKSMAAVPASASSSKSPVVGRPPTKAEVDRAMASAEQPAASHAAKAGKPVKPAGKAPRAPIRGTVPTSGSAKATAGSGSYAVQVAAFSTKGPATELVSKLHGEGYSAYVLGTKAPYRVRIGHFPTHAGAAAELAKLKARHIDGFVADK